jgi:hypothetical protein
VLQTTLQVLMAGGMLRDSAILFKGLNTVAA